MEYITVEDFVKQVLATIPQPYGADVVDQFFRAVESDPGWMEVYRELEKSHGTPAVKNSIGFNIMSLARMRSLDRDHPATSRLISTYTELGPDPAAVGAAPADPHVSE